jgi:hypothetical protein
MITAFGIALVLAGLVTHIAVSMVGLILVFRGAIGWFREVFPAEQTVLVHTRPVPHEPATIISASTAVRRKAGEDSHRVRIPAEYHPYWTGIIGGIFGGMAMASVACAYGLIVYRSIWYPINLLAAAALPSLTSASLEQLRAFHTTGLLLAFIIHGAVSILVGLLFAVLLPMLPSRFAAFWGSLLTPLIWSALVGATLRLVNPALNARISWFWFITSQVAYGLVTGYIIAHSKRVETAQTWPLAARAGIEMPGLFDGKELDR